MLKSPQTSYEGFDMDSDATEDSESPRKLEGGVPKRVTHSLARRLTLEIIDRELVRQASNEDVRTSEMQQNEPEQSQLTNSDDDSLREVLNKMEGPVRYPGARGLPSFFGEDFDSAESEDRALRNELGNLHTDSFSCPTSPESLSRRRSRMQKAGAMLGLSTKNLRSETLRLKHDIGVRLSVEEESYRQYLDQTVKIARRSWSNPSGDDIGYSVLTSKDIPFEVILADPVHLKIFRMHAESNFCAESLVFWERVNDFKAQAEKDPDRVVALALNIWSNFLDAEAETQVLMKESLLEDVRKKLDTSSCDVSMFDACQKEAYSTMQFSLYPNYLAYLNATRKPEVDHVSDDSLHDVPSLLACLTEDEYSSDFHAFAVVLMCGENIDFWQRVRQLRAMRDPQAIARGAKAIWRDFLSPSSPTELNIGSKTRRAIRYEVENNLCSSSTFNDAQREIYKLISLDVYPKFCQKLKPEGEEEDGNVAQAAPKPDAKLPKVKKEASIGTIKTDSELSSGMENL